MIRCAIYTRTNVATNIDQAQLHRVQRKAARAFIARRKRRGWKCVKAYADVGQSAVHLNRPALQHLLADIAAGQIDCVVVYSLDRLARCVFDQARLFRKFRRRGVMLAVVCPESVNVPRRTAEMAPAATRSKTKRRRSGPRR